MTRTGAADMRRSGSTSAAPRCSASCWTAAARCAARSGADPARHRRRGRHRGRRRRAALPRAPASRRPTWPASASGVPGLVDPRTGEVVHAVNLGIAEHGGASPPLLADRLRGVPVRVENDLNVAAVGAARALDLDGDLAFLAPRHRRRGRSAAGRAGCAADRRGGAGEIGHLPLRPRRSARARAASAAAWSSTRRARRSTPPGRAGTAGPLPPRSSPPPRRGTPRAVDVRDALRRRGRRGRPAPRAHLRRRARGPRRRGGGGGPAAARARGAAGARGRPRLAVPAQPADRRPAADRPRRRAGGADRRGAARARSGQRRRPATGADGASDAVEVVILARPRAGPPGRRRPHRRSSSSGQPDAVLGLATGSCPLGIYAELARRHRRAGELDVRRRPGVHARRVRRARRPATRRATPR